MSDQQRKELKSIKTVQIEIKMIKNTIKNMESRCDQCEYTGSGHKSPDKHKLSYTGGLQYLTSTNRSITYKKINKEMSEVNKIFEEMDLISTQCSNPQQNPCSSQQHMKFPLK